MMDKQDRFPGAEPVGGIDAAGGEHRIVAQIENIIGHHIVGAERPRPDTEILLIFGHGCGELNGHVEGRDASRVTSPAIKRGAGAPQRLMGPTGREDAPETLADRAHRQIRFTQA